VSGGAFLKSYIEERAIQIGLFVVENGATVRQTARKFGISKSTVHKDITTRLIHVQPELARQAKRVLQINKAERHIRGGLATKEKYSREVY
jgi:putative DeoR family transcriptional regulator (stage III sporulation protein D)